MATEPPHAYGSIDDELTVDVAVIGGGIAGLTTAYLCQTKGKRVAVIDAAQMASGVTGNTTAKITALQEPIYAKLERDYGANVATAYATANLAALDTIDDIIKKSGIECSFERKPAYTYATSAEGAERLGDEARAAVEAGLQVREATEFGLPFDATSALQLDDQAQFHARRYCLGLADAIASGGGVVAENVRATAVLSGDPCVVETERGTIRATDIVVATHIPFMYRGLYFAKTRPSRSYAIAARWGGPSVEGMYLSADAPVRSVREHRENGQTWIIVGGGSAKTAQDDPERQYEELRSWASEHFGITEPEYQWSAQDLVSGDGLPLIGTATPATPHIWIATGFRKWGMTNATTASEIITTAITGSEHPLAHVFAPRRHPTAMLRRMAGEVIDTAKHFVGDRIAAHRAEGPAPGEGAVFSRDGENVAVYVSDQGERLEVSAVCTHLGCLVAWNGAEKTWDCPCHGSRFAVDGSVIEGPAVEPLESLDEPRRKPA